MYVVPGGKALQLNRAAMRSCDAVRPLDTGTVEGWNIDSIHADENPVIEVTIGPTGGTKGYQGITSEQGLKFLYHAEKLSQFATDQV